MMFHKGFLLGFVVILLMGATYTRVTTFENEEILTAEQLNNEFDAIASAVNNIEDSQIGDGDISPVKIDSSIAGAGLDRDVSGVLSKEPRVVDADPAVAHTVGKGTLKSGTETGTTTEYVISNITLTTRGGAVLLQFSTDATATSDFAGCLFPAGETSTLRLYRDGTQIHLHGFGSLVIGDTYTADVINYPYLQVIDAPAAGTYDYELRATHSDNAIDCTYDEHTLYAVEL